MTLASDKPTKHPNFEVARNPTQILRVGDARVASGARRPSIAASSAGQSEPAIADDSGKQTSVLRSRKWAWWPLPAG